MKILHIEADTDTRTLVKELLGNIKGHTVMTVADGETGLRRIRQWKPQLILTELHLPRIDGFELIKTIKQNQHLTNIPIIVVSTLSRTLYRQQGQQLDVAAYLSKPLELDRLCRQVKQCQA
ncbi:response regulator [Anaerolineales bacterium HSG25]|nr:response regulator [Anaerolineales bacterium HSG25]